MTTIERFDDLIETYRRHPWLALVRAIELDRFERLRGLCQPPVLDLGCGDGFIAAHAFGVPVLVGVDIEETSVRAAAESGVYIAAIVGSANGLPFAAESFRSVYSNGALEHMDDLEIVLDEVKRVLVPGGIFVFLVPSVRVHEPVGLVATIFGKRLWAAVNRLHHHVNLLSADQWTTILERHGLQVEDVVPYGSKRVASYVAARELVSKLHVKRRPPFVALQHGGNIARLVSSMGRKQARRLADGDQDEQDQGYWLAIASRKTWVTDR